MDSELDLNDVIDLVANLSSISPLNQDNVINGVERYEDLSRSLTIEEQVSAILKSRIQIMISTTWMK